MCIRNGVNGFLFESENSDDLAEKLRALLSSPELRAKFGAAGRKIVRTELNEAEFGRLVRQMLEETVYGQVAHPRPEEAAQSVSAP
jgi:glycosyltransferase involved in cell wall biosynthesis